MSDEVNNVSVSRELLRDAADVIWAIRPSESDKPLDKLQCAQAERMYHRLEKALAQPSEQPGDVGRDAILRDGIGHALTMLRDLADEYDGDELPGDAHPVHKKAREIGHHLQGTLIQYDAALSPGVPVAWTLIDEDGEAQDIEFDETKARERAADYGWTVAALYLAPPANDEAVRLLDRARRELMRLPHQPTTQKLADEIVDFIASQHEEKG